jgi:hypothetical protein
MDCNVGGIERIGRILAGVALIIAAYGGLSGLGAILVYVAGAVLLGTGVIRFCPISKLLGINTCGEQAG